MVLISESLRGVHRPPFPVRLVSTRGSSAVQYNRGADRYFVADNFLSVASKGEVVLLGTDLDYVGTKMATVLAERFREKGAKPVRFSLAAGGYAFVGRFYTPEEMEACRAYDRLSAEVGSYFRRKYPDAPPTSISTAVAVKKVLTAPDRFKLPSRGTNTASVITKTLLRGGTVRGALSKLQKLYARGLIEYPRVDNDLIREKPFEVYAHRALTELGYEDEEVSPFEEEEIPFSPASVPLYLSVSRAATPSTVASQTERVKRVLNGREVREGFESYIRDCLAVAEEFEKEYYRLLERLHPRAKKVKVRIPRSPSEEWFRKLVLLQEKLDREEKVGETEEEEIGINL